MSASSASSLASLAQRRLRSLRAKRSTENATIDVGAVAGAYGLSSDSPALPEDAEHGLAPYQRHWVRDQARFKLWVKSRRIGGSYGAALDCALSASGLVVDEGGRVHFDPDLAAPQRIASATEERAKEFLGRVADHLYNLQRLCKVPLIDGEPAEQHIKLRNGVRCHALAPSPRSIRGGEGDVVLDEFAFMPKQADVWSAAKAVTDATLGRPHGYKLRVISTPFGDDDLFYRFAHGREGPTFSVHWCDVHQAIAQGFPADAEQLRQEARTEDEWQQEYLCQFLSAADRYISAELYDACTFQPEEAPSAAVQCTRFAGMDIARKPTGDLSAIAELRKIAGRLWFDRREEMRGASWPTQRAWVDDVLTRCSALAVDASNMGSQFAEELVASYGSRIDPVEFTSKSKEQLATGLRRQMESGNLRLPADDAELRRDVLSVRREITAHGNIRFDAPRTKDGHADRAWGLMLAVHAAGNPAPSPDVTTTGNERVSAGLRRARGVGSRIRGR